MLLDEIREQPRVLGDLLSAEMGHLQEIAREMRRRDVRQVLIAARGTSDNAAIYAKYLLGTRNRLPVALAAPSIYTLYGGSPQLDRTLVIGISQSGMSPDIVAVISDASQQGMMTLALTNATDSRLAQAAEHVVGLHAGEERAVAATKSYTAELLALAMLSVALDGAPALRDELAALPGVLAATLDLTDYVESRAERYRYMDHCAVLSRGYNYATSFETALKLKELTYIGANPYSSADFLHGPIAVIEQGFPVVLIAPGGLAFAHLLALAQDLAGRGAELVIVSDVTEILGLAQTPLRLSSGVPEWLSPIAAVVPGQLLAYYLARSKGLDPERPRGLNKVTETR